MTTQLQTIYAEGRLIRGKWSDTDARGRQLLCLYTALAGDPKARPASCPAELAPQWVAHLLPFFDDRGTLETWPKVVERVIALAPRFALWSPEQSQRCEYGCRAVAVREAMRHTNDPRMLEVCERVATLCEAVEHGAPIDEDAFRAAWVVAEGAGLEVLLIRGEAREVIRLV